MSKSSDLHTKQMQDEERRREYIALKAEFDPAGTLIRPRAEARPRQQELAAPIWTTDITWIVVA